jgi:hypothetical protein
MLPSWPECVGMAERWAPVLLDTAVRSVAVLGLAGLAAVALRRGSAATRHWVWMLGVAGVLLLPMMTASLPGWRVLPPVVGGVDGVVSGVIVEGPALPDAADPVESVVPREETRVNDAGIGAVTAVGNKETASGVSAAAVPVAGVGVSAGSVGSGGRAAEMPKTVAARNSGLGAMPWTFWVVMIWLAGSVLVPIQA